MAWSRLKEYLRKGLSESQYAPVRRSSKLRIAGVSVYEIAYGPSETLGQSSGDARGLLAIGDRATGLIAIGHYARGVISIGAVSVGLFSFGPISIGLLGAVGPLALGSVALGGLAVGGVALGGGAVGYYADGGVELRRQSTRDFFDKHGISFPGLRERLR